MTLARAALGVVFCVAILGNTAAAETKIRTLSLAALPEATTIELRMADEEGADDLRLAVILADHLSGLLQEMGYTVVDVDGELIFRFAAEEPTYAQGNGRFRHAGAAADRTRADALGASLRGVTLARPAALSESDKDTYRLRVSVSRERQPPLWTGFIERSASGAERPAMYIDMADALMAFWGRSFSSAN